MKPNRPLSVLLSCAQVMLASLLLSGCGAQTSGGGGSDSSSRWLEGCQDDGDCGKAYDCLCGVCSRACSSDASCGDLHDDAACVESGQDCRSRAPDGVCALVCAEDEDCPAGACTAGSCVNESESEVAEAGVAMVPPDASSTEMPSDDDDSIVADDDSAITTEPTDVPLSDDDVEPEPVPPVACEPTGAELGTEDDPIECLEGRQVCVEECHYLCEQTDLGDGDWIRQWVLEGEGGCPLWSEEQCSEAIGSLWDMPRPCSRNEDCLVWGGQTEETACERLFARPSVAVAVLTSASDLEAMQTLFDEAVTGGCGSDTGYDHGPDEAFCEQGQCSVGENQCGEFCPGQVVASTGECPEVAGYYFDGERCQGLPCGCVGIDCDEMFDSLESCEAAQRPECLMNGFLDCLPVSFDFGDCLALLGIVWDGTECVGPVSGCGAPPGLVFDTVEECAAAHEDCPPPSEQELGLCTSDLDCTVVPYQHCCGSTKRAINVGYQWLYEATPEWQVYDAPECAMIGSCMDDSAVTVALCEFEGASDVGTCQLVFP